MTETEVSSMMQDVLMARNREAVERFVVTSNTIENIHRSPTDEEIGAHFSIVKRDNMTIKALEQFVSTCQPDAYLRNKKGDDVIVGGHRPPPGGSEIPKALRKLLDLAESNQVQEPMLHLLYEWLHPFTDGNGRSGRVLWLWHMSRTQGLERSLRLDFLHLFYYQILSATKGMTEEWIPRIMPGYGSIS